MTGPAPGRGVALVLGVTVTFLWATSVVLIRIGLTSEPVEPIGFAGTRFALAAVILLAVSLPRLRAARAWAAGPRLLVEVGVYGLLMFCVAQVAFYLALGDLSAATVGLLMGLAPVVTALITLRSRDERASRLQLVGVVILLAGVVAFFGIEPVDDAPATAWLAAIAIPIVVGVSARLGRHVALHGATRLGGPLGLTALAMMSGGIVTFVLAIILEGPPAFSMRAWLLISWLAVVNTALTYTLWTQTQRTLKAVESSVLGDLTVILVAIVGWLVLDESLDLVQALGLLAAVVGVVLVQLAPGFGRARSLPVPPAEGARG